ncbi:MAG: ABC transporter permease [candidate division Zixibacteria bacterium]|nr:ABC transporter permease [candidate division Zixibacteria bacterium]
MQPLIGFQTLVWREIVRFLSVIRQTIFPPVVSSFLYIFILGFYLGGRIYVVEGLPYLTFIIPGLIMMYVIDSSYQNTSSSLFISRWQNNIEELLVTPLSYIEMVLAMLIGGLARSLVTASGVFLVSLIFVRFPVAHPWAVLYFFVFVSLIFSSIGMIVGLFAEEFEHLTVATTFVITPLIFFGGVFHSIAMVPEPLRWLTVFNPMFYMISGMRYGMLGVQDAPVGTSVAVVFFLFLSLFMITVHLFKIGFKLRK